jgi:L-fucose mutarotase/ribose pyranase (RbsD/FucU family)
MKDPSLKEIMGNVWESGLESNLETSGIRLAIVATEQGKVQQTFPKTTNNQLQHSEAFLYTWKKWEEPAFYERLKKSYGIMREAFRTTELKKGNDD